MYSIMHHSPLSIWVTGLSGSEKTTLANHVSALFGECGVNIRILDGDNLRKG
jgi:adenylylsulfate kinase-like enzyme